MASTEIVNLAERARTAIGLGESHFREFKSALEGAPGKKVPRDIKAICRDIGETLVAFANADGGELLIGVEDDGTVTGIDPLSQKLIEALENAPTIYVHSKTPLPPLRNANVELDGHRVLYFSIYKSTTQVHLTSDGRCLQRRDLETVPIPQKKFSWTERSANLAITIESLSTVRVPATSFLTKYVWSRTNSRRE